MARNRIATDPAELAVAREVSQSAGPFLRGLPKIELHVHIEGTLLPALRWKLAQRNGITLQHRGKTYNTLEELEASYAGTYNHRIKTQGDDGRPTFFEMYYGGMDVLRSEQDFYNLAMDYFRVAKDMNVRYVEPFFDPQAHTRRSIELGVIMDGFARAKADAESELGIKSRWTMCFLRDMTPESAMDHYEAALPYRSFVNAIGLDSDEYDRPPTLFDAVYRRAQQDGIHTTAHCDVAQKDTHEHIRQVTDVVAGTGLERIDHGLNAAEDPKLVELIKSKDLGMTLCPWAYYRHEPKEEVFPRIRALFDAGIKVTINSDDPGYMFFNYVLENLRLVEIHCGFSKKEMVQLQKNAVAISWMSKDEKVAMLKELDQYVADNEGLQ